jgi:hypothetical protein
LLNGRRYPVELPARAFEPELRFLLPSIWQGFREPPTDAMRMATRQSPGCNQVRRGSL